VARRSAELLERQAVTRQDLLKLRAVRTLVMEELPEPRTTTVFGRGDFRAPGEAVQPGTPAVLPPLANPRSRLDLARWLVDRDNPLAARVTVNRWWAELFGRGLVGTVEDFGVKGDPPTHPELLDWLAVEFMEGGWGMKAVLRQIVTSATYRQSSRVTPELLAKDDQNLLLARGPRFRLDAEAVRDNALAAAGLLALKFGGPPVRPYQPEGLWDKRGGDRVEYKVSSGQDRYRRGLYTVWKRTSPYPSMVNFDAAPRLVCSLKRSRSNTPLQALTLLNDPVYVEAAKALAARALAARAGEPLPRRLAHAFRICLARKPEAEELAVLRRLWARQSAAHRADPASARELVADFPLPPGVGVEEFATWFDVHDLNATILYLLGLDHERLTYKYQGREFRLTDVHGQVVKALLA
jgi:hypothetical protein